MDIHQFQQCLYCLEEVDFVQKWFDESSLGSTALSYDKIKEMSVMFFVNVPKIQNVSLNNTDTSSNNNGNTNNNGNNGNGAEDNGNMNVTSKAAKILGLNDKPGEKKRTGSSANEKYDTMKPDKKKKKGSKEKINRDKEDKNLDRSISERHVIVRKSTITSSLGLGKKPHSSQELLDSVSISSQEDVAFKESFWRIFSSDEKFKAQLKDVLLRDILELVDQQKKEIESLKAEVKKLQRQ